MKSSALFVVILLLSSLSIAAPSCSDHDGLAIELSGADPNARETTGSFLIWHKGQPKILVNASAGAIAEISGKPVITNSIDIILQTNLLVGNSAGLPVLVSIARQTNRRRILSVYGPVTGKIMSSTVNMVRTMFDSKRGTYRHLGDVLSPFGSNSYKLRAFDVSNRRKLLLAGKGRAHNGVVSVYEQEGLSIKATDTGNGLYPSLAWQVAANNQQVTIIDAKTANSQALDSLANRSQLLLVRLGKPGAISDWAALTATDAGSLAYRSESEQLLISYHAATDNERQANDLATIRTKYAGLAGIVQPGNCILLPKKS